MIPDPLARAVSALEHAIEAPRAYRASVSVQPYPRLSLVVLIEHPDARRRAALIQARPLPREERRCYTIHPGVPSWPLWASLARLDTDPPSLDPVRYISNADIQFPVPDDDDEFIAILASTLAEKGHPL